MNQDSHCRIKITKSLSEKGDLFSRYALKEATAITACSVTSVSLRKLSRSYSSKEEGSRCLVSGSPC